MAADSSLGEQLLAQGWRGGSVFHPNEHASIAAAIGRPSIPESAWIVVLSQTCDVVAHTLEQEPFVEILICSPVAKLRSQFKNRKSTRRIDFRPNRDTHPDVALTAHATADRYHLSRDKLSGAALDEDRCLSNVAFSRLSSWYALRYTRPAWPDAFVRRVATAREALIAAIDTLGDDITEIRVNINPVDVELPDHEPYSVSIFFVVDEEAWLSEPDTRAAVQQAFVDFTVALRACPQIDVSEEFSGVQSGAEFSWQQTQLTQPWNFAYLSDRDSE